MSRGGMIWAVHTPEPYVVPGPYIPTLGNPAGASDIFRVSHLHSSGLEGENACITDPHTCAALGRLIEGGVSRPEDIEGAEAALQVLMWHDRVDVLVPGFKFRNGGLAGYARENDPRSELSFELFRPLDAWDQILAVEAVVVEDQKIVHTNLRGSGIEGLSLEQAKATYLKNTPPQAAVLAAVPGEIRIPAYFSDPWIEPFTSRRGVFGFFYEPMRREWDAALKQIPVLDFSVKLPPLLSIVLDRASDRDSIPVAIVELREELAPVRQEMWRFSEKISGALDQRELENQFVDLEHSFGAVVGASRKRKASIVLPVLKLYDALVKKPLATAINWVNPEYVPNDPQILANRTATGRTFSKLLQTDSMHSLVTHFLADDEIRKLEDPSSSSGVDRSVR